VLNSARPNTPESFSLCVLCGSARGRTFSSHTAIAFESLDQFEDLLGSVRTLSAPSFRSGGVLKGDSSAPKHLCDALGEFDAWVVGNLWGRYNPCG